MVWSSPESEAFCGVWWCFWQIWPPGYRPLGSQGGASSPGGVPRASFCPGFAPRSGISRPAPRGGRTRNRRGRLCPGEKAAAGRRRVRNCCPASIQKPSVSSQGPLQILSCIQQEIFRFSDGTQRKRLPVAVREAGNLCAFTRSYVQFFVYYFFLCKLQRPHTALNEDIRRRFKPPNPRSWQRCGRGDSRPAARRELDGGAGPWHSLCLHL